jgi:hypothetical protein
VYLLIVGLVDLDWFQRLGGRVGPGRFVGCRETVLQVSVFEGSSFLNRHPDLRENFCFAHVRAARPTARASSFFDMRAKAATPTTPTCVEQVVAGK